MPLVSVLLPVYNAAEFLEDAIQSVRDQSFEDFELIIINDGSTDRSREVVFSFADQRIRYFENEENLGIVATLNKGVGLCRGQYIARMDADDLCERSRLGRQVRFLERHPKIGVCGTWATVIDGTGQATGRIVHQTDPQMVRIALLFTVPVLHPSVMARAELLKENPYEAVVHAEDYDLWVRLAGHTQLANLPRRLMRYRWHGGNISQEKQHEQLRNTDKVILRQLAALGLNPDKEQLRIHRLSFLLYSYGGVLSGRVTRDDLRASQEWFATLIRANRSAARYDPDSFMAFLWARYMVLCRAAGVRRWFPLFASLRPAVVRRFIGQLRLLAKK